MCRSPSDVKFESSNKIEPQFCLRCIWFFPHTFKNFKLSKTFLSFPGISNEKYFGKKEVCPKQQGQCDGDTEAAPWGAGWGQHRRAETQGPIPGAAPGQGRALVLLSSQVSDSPCSHRTFWGEVSMISPFRTFFSHINNHTQNLAEEFLSPHPHEGPTYWDPKIILSPPLARHFYKAVSRTAIRVLIHMGALPSFAIFLLLRKSIYELKETQDKSQFTMQLGTLIKHSSIKYG